MSLATVENPSLRVPLDDPPRGMREPRWYRSALVTAAIVGSLLTVPYANRLLEQVSGLTAPGESSAVGRIYSAALVALFSVVLVVAGTHLGRAHSLAWPPLRAWKPRRDSRATWGHSISLSVGFGVVSAVVVLGLSAAAPVLDAPVVDAPTWDVALLAAIGAGISEEIWFRLGVMTVVASALANVYRFRSTRTAIWSGNLVAALLFGMMHLPLADALGWLTAWVWVVVLLGNGVVGVLCGWLYWRLGILAAIVAHISAGFVLKVVLPMLDIAGL